MAIATKKIPLTINGSRFDIDVETRFAEYLETQLLASEFRLAVILCDVYDFSYKEIAEILGCPVGTVMSRLHRGRRLLQKSLYDYAVEQGYLQPIADGGMTDLDAYRRSRKEG